MFSISNINECCVGCRRFNTTLSHYIGLRLAMHRRGVVLITSSLSICLYFGLNDLIGGQFPML